MKLSSGKMQLTLTGMLVHATYELLVFNTEFLTIFDVCNLQGIRILGAYSYRTQDSTQQVYIGDMNNY